MPNRDPRKTSNPGTHETHNRRQQQENPKRPWPEGPGGSREAKGVSDARNKSTRSGDR